MSIAYIFIVHYLLLAPTHANIYIKLHYKCSYMFRCLCTPSWRFDIAFAKVTKC